MKKHLLILAGIVFLSLSALYSQGTNKGITLKDIYKSGKFYPEFIKGFTPMKDGRSYAQLEDGEIALFDFKTGKKIKTLVKSEQLIPEGDTAAISMNSFTFSPDESKILFATAKEHIYRHSFRSEYYIFDLNTGKLRRLSKGGKQQVATFSPDSKKIGFVRKNNLFYVDLEKDLEIQITTDGRKNHIIYGTTDWVYEEEFSFIQGFHWSPDSKKIALYRFDESKVKTYSFPKYTGLYPEQYTYKYPKAGERNSIVDIYIYNLEHKEKKRSFPPPPPGIGDNGLPMLPGLFGNDLSNMVKVDLGKEKDIYVPRIKWTKDPEQLAVYKMNRLQNELTILLADVKTGKTKPLYHEKNKYYIEITDDLYFTDDGKHFLITSEKSGYNHIYLYSMEGKEIRQVTRGNWDVTEFSGYDSKKKRVYYVSAERGPLYRDVYRIQLDGKNKKRLSEKAGTNEPGWNRNFTYYVNTYSAADTPPVFTINDANGKIIRTLEDNAAFKNKLKDYHFVPKEFFTFKTEDGVELNAWMIKPYDFDGNKKYPLLMYFYGGPGSQTVRDEWGYSQYFWFQYLAQNGIIVVSVDNRGTGARGEEFKKMTYKQLGKYETIDQIASAKHFGSLPYIDKDKIAVFGWSFGGYLSSLCITKGADVFNSAVAVAPVTNWRYYDNIYTERYMQRPQDNPSGYDDNSPINFVDKLEGNYLLIHGTADDNVHFQNTVEMVKALTAANKKFDLMIYPDSNHGIYTGRNTRYHLFSTITDFLFEHLRNKN